jgi:hypothetical protein
MADPAVSTDTAPCAPEGTSVHADTTAPKDDTANKAIVRCMRAWNYAYKKKAADEDSTGYQAEKAGNEAYLKATPPLVGYKNICDFIACINFASMTGIITRSEATHYLAIASRAASNSSSIEYSSTTRAVVASIGAMAALLHAADVFGPLPLQFRPGPCFNTLERFHQVLHRIGHAEAEVAFPVTAKRRSGKRRHTGLFQQRVGKPL